MSPPATVAVLEPGYADYSVERRILAPVAATVAPVAVETDAVPALRTLDPAAVLVRERPVTAAEIDAHAVAHDDAQVRAGVDNIDLATATARGIRVANVPDYGAEHEVSDHAVALYLAVARRIVTRDRDVRAGTWGVGQAERIPGHRGAVLGLIGYGRIARRAAAKFQALGFSRILAHDPNMPADRLAQDGVIAADINTICREADLVSLHAPLLPETRHILGRARIALMKPTTVVVNVSRGGLIDETALADALKTGRLFGAGLDVFEHEPLAPSNPLLAAPNTVVSDHTAWYSEHSVALLQEHAAAEVLRVLSGEAPLHWVNR